MIKILIKANNHFKINYPNLKQFFDFCFVGFSIAIIDFGLTFILKDVVHLDKYFSNTAGLVTALITKFFLHRYWVFREQADTNKAAERTKFVKFIIVSVIGIGLNNGVIFLLSLTSITWTLWFYFSKVIATGIVLIWNFFANKFWTFKKQPV